VRSHVEDLSPAGGARVHEYTLVPPDIRMVLPSGSHVMSRSVLPSTTWVSVSIFFESMSICLMKNAFDASWWTKLTRRVPGLPAEASAEVGIRCSERPMPLAATSPFPVFTLASCSEFGWPSTNNASLSASTHA
jgi:hypothetical protein